MRTIHKIGYPRRFQLLRKGDVSGVSGTGPVAEGVEFSNGRVVLVWCGELSSQGSYDSIDDMLRIHDHKGTEFEGKNQVIWMDKDPTLIHNRKSPCYE